MPPVRRFLSNYFDLLFTEIWRFNDFQNGGSPPSWILKICRFCHVALVDMAFCLLIRNFAEIGQSVGELWPKNRFSRWRRPSWILKISVFGHVTVMGFNICCSVPNFIKIARFALRYGDLAIFKMAAVRHVGFVMTSQYCIAGHIFVFQILSWNFLLIGFVVSEILAISYVAFWLYIHNGAWQFWGCACAVPRDP